MTRFLITGTAGFIGFHLARRLLGEGHSVVGFDAITDYYDPRLKRARHALLEQFSGFRPVIAWLEDEEALQRAADLAAPEIIIHLAAQAGVRYSIEAPHAYVGHNVVGSFNLLEVAKRVRPRHLLLASTSSVYGGSPTPFCETDRTDWPITLYAATKKAMEAMAHSHAHLWRIPTTCFRFFTVYGPWGRPDMALFKFVDAMLAGRPIELYGHGAMRRDFTYIDDIVSGVAACIANPPPDNGEEKAGGSVAPHRLYNIGNNRSEELTRMISLIEESCGREAVKEMAPLQPGDVPETYADISAISGDLGYEPTTPIAVGIPNFVAWYRDYHGV